MATFHTLKIKDIYKETKDCSVISFDIPQHLQEAFKFRQGQHLTLKANINNEDVRRSYSLCSGPEEGKWQVAVKQIPGGKFSTYVNTTLKPGDTIEVMPPSGNFGVASSPTTAKNYIFFAAGSGITPILSMLKAHLKNEPNAHTQLFYVNRTAKSILFKEQLENLRNTYFGRLEIFHFLTKEQRDNPLLNGRIDKAKVELLTKSIINASSVDEAFICGPEAMIFQIKDALTEAGLKQEHIHYELFVTGLSEADKQKAAKALEQKVIGTKITLIDGGKEFHFTMTDEYDNILDGALAAGADLPFACKGGVCSTCKCKLEKGSVEMKVNYALEPFEIEQNLILSCQAVPTSQEILVNFDV